MELFLSFCLGAIAVAFLLWFRVRHYGFAGQVAMDYDGEAPAFDIREVLNGPLLCEGVIYGPTGKVSSRFVADFHATWDGNSGRMTEEFRYDSGENQSREWRLTVEDNGRIRAEADDLVGTGRGQQAGHGVCLNYRIKLPAGAGGHVLDAIDWMYLVENGTIINRSQFRKFGIKVAELVATIRPAPEAKDKKKAA